MLLMLDFVYTRLLTTGECHYEDEARKVVERMVNQAHVVGEGYGRADIFSCLTKLFFCESLIIIYLHYLNSLLH
jgi:hypothetical protein